MIGGGRGASRVASAARGATRATKAASDVKRAQEGVDVLVEK